LIGLSLDLLCAIEKSGYDQKTTLKTSTPSSRAERDGATSNRNRADADAEDAGAGRPEGDDNRDELPYMRSGYMDTNLSSGLENETFVPVILGHWSRVFDEEIQEQMTMFYTLEISKISHQHGVGNRPW
jgi:hypothetical protein